MARHRYQVLMPDFSSGPELVNTLVEEVSRQSRIQVETGTAVGRVQEKGEGFQVELLGPGGKRSQEFQAIVLATGFKHFDAHRDGKYGYGVFPDVLTGSDLEERIADGHLVRPSNGEVPQSVAFIYCVGSRDRQVGNTYCSRVCCAVSAKQGIELRRSLPLARIVMFYMDVRTYGLWEDQLYWRAQEEAGIVYVKGRVAEITQRQGHLVLKGEDTLVRGPFEWDFDLVVLATGMEPSASTRDLSEKFGVDTESHGFFRQAGPLDSAALTNREGVFVAGTATGPKAIEDAIMEGDVAAMAVLRYLRMKVRA